MNNWIDLLHKHINKLIAIPAFTSALVWGCNVLLSILDDGQIDEQEFHNLLGYSSSAETIILVIVMAILRVKR